MAIHNTVHDATTKLGTCKERKHKNEKVVAILVIRPTLTIARSIFLGGTEGRKHNPNRPWLCKPPTTTTNPHGSRIVLNGLVDASFCACVRDDACASSSTSYAYRKRQRQRNGNSASETATAANGNSASASASETATPAPAKRQQRQRQRNGNSARVRTKQVAKRPVLFLKQKKSETLLFPTAKGL